ncbi:MAG: alpha-L-fucosidase, partial [Bryobacteraceae bacterium]
MLLTRRDAIRVLSSAAPSLCSGRAAAATTGLEIEPGPFVGSRESLKDYRIPEWFRDAKFGIWAHWGPQCEPEQGDWYARLMYVQGQPDYDWQVAHYGHPSKVGFKDVIHRWHAEHWDPDKLVALYARAGAQYFFALADHHDNFD